MRKSAKIKNALTGVAGATALTDRGPGRRGRASIGRDSIGRDALARVLRV